MSHELLIFHSGLAPEAFRDTLGRTTDKRKWSPFSLSGFKGEQPILEKIDQQSFQLSKRWYYRNDFAGEFYATYARENSGTRIEGYFDSPVWARYFMRVWLAFAVVIGIPIFAMSLSDLTASSHYMTGNLWVGLIVPPALVCFGFVLPRIGRLLSRGEEKFILEFIKTAFAARLEEAQTE